MAVDRCMQQHVNPSAAQSAPAELSRVECRRSTPVSTGDTLQVLALLQLIHRLQYPLDPFFLH